MKAEVKAQKLDLEQGIKKEIKHIVRQVIEKYKPIKVILFGSISKGEFNNDSDVDLLIIKEKTPYLGRERAREIRRLIKKNLPVDFFVYSPEEFNERVRMGDPFIRAILREGEVLYDG
jgi:predicted nucleotidyltransferase